MKTINPNKKYYTIKFYDIEEGWRNDSQYMGIATMYTNKKEAIKEANKIAKKETITDVKIYKWKYQNEIGYLSECVYWR